MATLSEVKRNDVPGICYLGSMGAGTGGPPVGAFEDERQTDRMDLCDIAPGLHHIPTDSWLACR